MAMTPYPILMRICAVRETGKINMGSQSGVIDALETLAEVDEDNSLDWREAADHVRDLTGAEWLRLLAAEVTSEGPALRMPKPTVRKRSP